MTRTRALVSKELPAEIELISHRVIGCAIEVHKELGPGLLERLYEDALVYELREAGIRVEQQLEIIVPYKGVELRGQRLDVLVEGCLVVELKAVSQVTELHRAQLLSYLRAARLPLGLLLNFNVTWLREGLHRVFNERAIPMESSSSHSSRPSRSKV
ncbi:MAG TPA: GxxExxY protein [Phycisphaerales bacterium]|nr:GxxExxY protein [Phycisphaerales bacterium]